MPLDCTVETFRPGRFEGQLHVFLDDLGLREIVLKVRGQAQAADSQKESPTKQAATTTVAQDQE